VEKEGKDAEPSHADPAEADVPDKPRRKAAGAAQGKIAGVSQLQALLQKSPKRFHCIRELSTSQHVHNDGAALPFCNPALSEFTRDHENDSKSPKKVAQSSVDDPAAASPSEYGMPSPVAVRRPELRPAPALASRPPAEVRAILMQEARGSKLTPLETQYVVGRSGLTLGSTLGDFERHQNPPAKRLSLGVALLIDSSR
jgi:hypothetical protein